MTLMDYIESRERDGATKVKARIAKAAGLRWATVHDIARGACSPHAETAKAIEAATGGEVTAHELLGLSAA